MIWMASYPRSGNTFLRIVLYEVYGIESSAFHSDPNRSLAPNYSQYKVVKTHLLPHQLVPNDSSIPAVYIVRDGRDSIISLAHQSKDLISSGKDFNQIMSEAILAAKGSFFGGWSNNVESWLPRADIVMKFEELIENPIDTIEQLRKIIDLPKPDIGKLPTFDDLRSNRYRYGSGSSDRSARQQYEHRKKFFRKGQPGSWREEMPEHLKELFWQLHGKTMIKLGYIDGLINSSVVGSMDNNLKG